MSSSQLAPDDVDGRVEVLQKRIDALAAAVASGRRTRQMMLLAFLAFVLVAGWGFYSLANTVRSQTYQDQLVAQLQKTIQDNQDTFSKEAQLLSDGVVPVVHKAMSEQAKKDAPLFMQAIEKERAVLVAELPQKLLDRVEERHHELLREHEQILVEELPAAQDPKVRERMMANAYLALDQLVKKYYADEYTRLLQSMSNTWNDFPAVPPPAKDDPPLDQQLIGQLMDLLAIKMTHHPMVADATP